MWLTDVVVIPVGVQSVRVSEIVVNSGRRRLGDVADLANSIRLLGLLNPITITTAGVLVAGYHRLEACRSLGWEMIPASVVSLGALDAELAEIDENQARNDLTVLERAELLAKRKANYLARFPETRNGAFGGGLNGVGTRLPTENVIVTFSVDTATVAGVSASTIQQETRIATRIAEDVRDSIRNTDMADTKVELLALAKLEPAQQRDAVEKVQTGQVETVRQAVALAKVEERRAEVAETLAALPVGQYAVIAADPPWSYSNSGLTQSAESHYPTMATEDICLLDVPARCVPESVLFLWATSPLLPDALTVMAAWGFAYKASLVWDKGQAPGIGWFVRTEHEFLLIGTREANVHPLVKVSSVLRTEPGRHSAKPAEAYALIEQMYSGPYLEMFAREQRPGWHVWGNEV